MIVEAIVRLLSALLRTLGGMFGTLDIPAWWQNVGGWLSTMGEAAAGFGQWVPIGTAVNAVIFVMGCLSLAFVIKVVRIVASFFSAGGGSAA